MALVFLFPKEQSPSFGIKFDTKKEAEETNFMWHNIIADWQAKFEIEGVRVKLTIWLPGTPHKHTYTIYEWNKEDFRKFLNECKKIFSVEFYHFEKGSNNSIICLTSEKNRVWKINVRKIELVDYTSKTKAQPLGHINEWPKY